MLDDDIEYIGRKTGDSSRQTVHPSMSSRTLTGVVFHVESDGLEPAYRMLFRRATSTVVHIGRPPPPNNGASLADERDQENLDGKASFRCPVVSRQHAKLTFSEVGCVFITDLKSHHGTHIRKTYELFSTQLKPNFPTRLSEGDVITFGKTVGKGNTSVTPVVLRVELLFGNLCDESAKNSFKLNTTSEKSVSSKSGRYGLNSSTPGDASPSSYASDDSRSGDDSEIEEISPPAPLPIFRSLASVSGFFPTFRKNFSYAARSVTPQPPSDILEPSPFESSEEQDSYRLLGFDYNHHDIYDDEPSISRLSSPPTQPIIGAWPFSREQSVVTNESQRKDSEAKSIEQERLETPPVAQNMDSGPANIDKSTDIEELKTALSRLENLRKRYKARFNANVQTTRDRLQDIRGRMNEFDDMALLMVTHKELEDVKDSLNNLEHRFDNTSAHQTKVEDRMATQWQFDELQQKVSGVVRVDVPSLQAQVDSLQDQLDAIDPRRSAAMLTEIKENAEKLLRAAMESELGSWRMEMENTTLSKRKRCDADDLQDDRVITSTTSVAESIHIPTHKRARTHAFVSTVVRTATVGAVGAVAAWAALAFS